MSRHKPAEYRFLKFPPLRRCGVVYHAQKSVAASLMSAVAAATILIFLDCNVGFFTSSLDYPIEMLSKLSWSGLLTSRVAETGADLPEEPQGC